MNVRTSWLLAGLVGCGKDRDPPPGDDGVEPTVDTASTADTGDTADTTEPVVDPGGGNLPASAVRWRGTDAYDRAGWAVDLADVLADVPGEEILVGTPSNFLYGYVKPAGNAGAYLLLPDASAGALDEVARTFFVPDHNGDFWGNGIAGIGDVTGDGKPDVFVGGIAHEGPYLGLPIFSEPEAGHVVFDDAAGWWSVEGPELDGAGFFADEVRACGDVDGDSIADLCGASGLSNPGPEEVSEALVLLGPITGPYNALDAPIRLQGPAVERAGRHLASADFDSDGRGDLLLGAFERDAENGGAYLATDLSPGVRWLPDGPVWTGEGGQAGQAVVAGGDLDGDGRVDGFVGAPHLNQGTGRGYVVVDAAGGPLADAHATFDGTATADFLGLSAAMGDFDGDGAGDLAVGVPGSIYGLDRPGRVAVFTGPIAPGPHTLADAAAVWSARDGADAFGWRMASGDVDVDGRVDLLVGAPYDSALVEEGGSVVLLPGGGL